MEPSLSSSLKDKIVFVHHSLLFFPVSSNMSDLPALRPPVSLNHQEAKPGVPPILRECNTNGVNLAKMGNES